MPAKGETLQTPKVNRVWAEPIADLLQECFKQMDEYPGQTQSWLADKLDVHNDTIYKIVVERRSKTIDFDFADEILCAMNLQHHWWGRLSEVYYGAVLDDEGEKRPPYKLHEWIWCARTGCGRKVMKTHPRQKYCSSRCQKTQWGRKAHGATPRERHIDVCPAGHPRTEENTQVLPDNRRPGHKKMRCRICYNEKRRATYARKKEEQARAV